MNRKTQTVLIFSFWLTGLTLHAYHLELPTDTIPVVVHVIHTGTPIGAADNPPDSLIEDLLDLMNNVFQKNGPDYGGADIDLAFQLARRSPTCTSTTGINRMNGNGVPDYSSGGITTDTMAYPNSAHELQVKALSRWPNTDYLNIWVVNTIDGNPNFPGGYAFFPEYNSALTDGIVLRSSVINGTNKTIIHELGHYFYLYHTFGLAWGGCLSETNCLTDGDIICDTENCNYQFACSADINPCTDEEWLIADEEHQYTVLNNYMGYTDCQWMFTEGQKARILYALNTFRPGLLSSHGLDTIMPPDMTMACIPVAQNGLSPYYGIERVEIGPLEVYSNTSAADGNFYIDRTCNQSLYIAAGDNIPIHITCSYQNYSQVRVYLDLNNDGEFDLPDELMSSGNGGLVVDTLAIPLTGIELCAPHRLRIVVDHPAAPSPTPCLLVGTQAEGVGQIEDYALIIQPRIVESVNSGDWDDAATWTCNCIPTSIDFVYIKAGDIISITPAMGVLECADIHLEPGAELEIDGDLIVAGGCY
ncbi:MAG TPA: M43 family zinc metalloprotease [Saprospiraceae bacterium]